MYLDIYMFLIQIIGIHDMTVSKRNGHVLEHYLDGSFAAINVLNGTILSAFSERL